VLLSLKIKLNRYYYKLKLPCDISMSMLSGFTSLYLCQHDLAIHYIIWCHFKKGGEGGGLSPH
jgi:hypothetical protein